MASVCTCCKYSVRIALKILCRKPVYHPESFLPLSCDDDDDGDDDAKNTEDRLYCPGERPRKHTAFSAAGAMPHGPPRAR